MVFVPNRSQSSSFILLFLVCPIPLFVIGSVRSVHDKFPHAAFLNLHPGGGRGKPFRPPPIRNTLRICPRLEYHVSRCVVSACRCNFPGRYTYVVHRPLSFIAES